MSLATLVGDIAVMGLSRNSKMPTSAHRTTHGVDISRILTAVSAPASTRPGGHRHRRRLADRGLSSAAQDIGPHATIGSPVGGWFVQMADPNGALLNTYVSYRITGDIDLARLRDT